MLEVMQFVFSSFWVWLGSLMLLCMAAGAAATISTGGRR